MQELKLIENELVPVYVTSTGEKVVYGSELHEVLGVKSKFADWIKNRLNDCEASEYEDFETFSKILEKGRPSIDYIIKLNTAKEMAMLERNEKGKQVRRYFITVEEKYNQGIVDRSQLSPQMQMFYVIADGQAKMELEQKRQAEQISQIEENQKAISTAMQGRTEENYSHWVNRCLSTIAESDNYHYIGNRQERHKAVRTESYERLKDKRPCRLNQRVDAEQGRALRAGASAERVKAITKLYIIEHDKDLKPVYESVIREMMICYCVDTKEKEQTQ